MAKEKKNNQLGSLYRKIDFPKFPVTKFKLDEKGFFESEKDRDLFDKWHLEAVNFCNELCKKLRESEFGKYNPEVSVENLRKELEKSNLPELLFKERIKEIQMSIIESRDFLVGFEEGLHNKGFFDLINEDHQRMLVEIVENYLYAVCLSKKLNFLEAFDQNKNDLTVKVENKSKIKWLGKPSVLGYIFNELARQGFIQYPGRNGDANYAGLAKQVLATFECDTTPENLIKEMNPNKNTLSDFKRDQIVIPDKKTLD